MAASPAPDELAGGADPGHVAADPRIAADRPLTRPDGLNDDEVAARVADGRVNTTEGLSSRPLKDIVRANVLTPFNALLGALGALVLLTGAIADALFLTIVVVNSGIGIVQELRAKATLDRLAVLNQPRVQVLRNGAPVEVTVGEVVLDDLVLLRPGDQIPADGWLRSTAGLEVDESLLTGESDSVSKEPGAAVLSGTNVVAGAATAQITAVGADSFAYRLTEDARRFSLTKSELTEGINHILKYVAVAIAVAGPILFVSQSATAANWRDAIRGAVAGLVGMVPEGLVLLASITFFAAALTLARRRVLVQELPSVESLARVDVLCLDKTGTLTEGTISFDAAEPIAGADRDTLDEALAAMADDSAGNATVAALHRKFPDSPGWERVAEVPFSSARKWSGATFAGRGTWVLGAPEYVMAGSPPDVELAARVQELASAGTRTLLLAHSNAALPAAHAATEAVTLPADLTAMAVVTFAEHVRADAADTLRYFAAQSVALKVISGDNPATVGAVARRVGLRSDDAPMDGRRLPKDQAALAEVVDAGSVFGRVSPQQKRSMVAALQSRGHVVAMTGDGVNDALALKDADIGVAMGSGTPAARAVAQLVLLDSEFSVLPGVVAEGRRVIANVERVANLFLTKNATSLVLALAVAVARWPFPFLPRHLTLVSTIAIGIPAFVLALGPSSQRFTPGLVRRVLRFAVPTGLVAAVAVFVIYGLARAAHDSPVQAKTAATIVLLGVSLWVLVVQARPLRPWKLALVAAMAGLGVLVFAIPAGRRFYDLRLPSVAITGEALAIAAAGAAFVEFASLWTLQKVKSK